MHISDVNWRDLPMLLDPNYSEWPNKTFIHDIKLVAKYRI